MSSRYPFTFNPRGWFQVAYSDELAKGAVQPLTAFGRELVLYRGEDGAARAFDAYCPHLGAHLGFGGKVVGDTLQCPFHGWRFDGAGKCVEVPNAPKIPPRAQVETWPLREVNGMLLLAHGGAPAWDVPALAEADGQGAAWTPWVRRKWRIRCHAEEIAENIVDPNHFRFVHDTLSVPEIELKPEGHVFKTFSRVKQPTPRGPVDGRIDAEGYGLGYWVVRFGGIIDLLLVSAQTPVDGEHVDLRLSLTVRKSDSGAHETVGKALIAEVVRQVEEDVPIWEHKMFRESPVLAAGDGSISALRKWARQFLDPV